MFFPLIFVLAEALDNYTQNKSKWWRHLCEKQKPLAVPASLSAYSFVALWAGATQGLRNGWTLSTFPLSWTIKILTNHAPTELLAFILAVALLYELHLQHRNLNTETILTKYRQGKTYILATYILLVISALIEANLIETVI